MTRDLFTPDVWARLVAERVLRGEPWVPTVIAHPSQVADLVALGLLDLDDMRWEVAPGIPVRRIGGGGE